MFVAELTLKPIRTVLLIFVSLEIRRACALMLTNITDELLLLHVDIGDVFVPDSGGSETFGALWAFVRAVAAVAPGMSLHPMGITMSSDAAANPSTICFFLDAMCYFKMLVHFVTKTKDLPAGFSVLASPLTGTRYSGVSSSIYQGGLQFGIFSSDSIGRND